MKWTLVALFAAGLTLNAYAQEAITEVKKLAYGNPYNAANENFINMMNALEDDDQFSLLLFDRWQSLEIKGNDEEFVIIDSANYHIEQDKIIFVQYGALYELYPELVERATLGQRTFVSLLYEEKKSTLGRGYFEVLVDGDYTLLSNYDMRKQTTNDSPLGLPATKEVELVKSEKLYYLTSTSRRPKAVPKKKSEFSKIFRRERDKVIAFAKKNHTSLKKTEDVVEIFEFYNGLVND